MHSKKTLTLAPLLLVGFLIGCGSDSGSGAPKTTLKDTKGRTCVDTAGEMTLSCDADPAPSAGCSAAGSKACFITGSMNGVTGPAAVCAGCYTSDSASSVLADCSPIVCSKDSECPSEYGSCVNSECVY